MTVRNLEYLFEPRSVALIGASSSERSIGRIVAENLRATPFRGPIWFVNPRYCELLGQPCFASVRDLPAPPDLAIIATPPATIPGIISELGSIGTRAAVVITAGIRAELRQQMLDAAKPNLMRIQGPNCIGLLLPLAGLNASFSHCMAAAGDLALVSQSGALVTAVLDWAASRSIGFSHVVSLGDMADVDFGDVLDYLASDTQSRAILLYMEHLTHAPKFMSAARRAARTKPVIVIKAGRHAEGARAAQSHTGALTGSDAAYDAALLRAGMLRVTELEDLFNAAETVSRIKKLRGERLAILTNGGGAGVLAADRLADLGGTLATLDAATLAALDTVLPPTWSHANPVDIIGDADATRYVSALHILSGSAAVDAVLTINCPTALASGTDIASAIVESRQTDGSAKTSLPLLTNWLGEAAAEKSRQIFAHEGIPSFLSPADAIEGFMQLVRYQRAQAQLMQTPLAMPESVNIDRGAARTIIDRAQRESREMLTEVEAKGLLAAYDIPVAQTTIATTPEDVAVAAAALLKNVRACVVKILSDDITHKSDVGGVALALTTPAAAERAARTMLQRISDEHPNAVLSGFTVQPMLEKPRAHELIVGVAVDKTFGPMIMFGAGGTAVEVLQDTALALPPLDFKLARDIIDQTRIARLLRGYRDRPPADIDAIAQTLMKVSALLIEHPEIVELDINPLLADEKGIVALDARVRVTNQAQHPRQQLAIRPYPREWDRPVNIARLGTVMLRPIRPSDASLYMQLIKRIRPEDMRMRFFIARPNLTPAIIASMTQIDYAREMAFVAIDAAKNELLGVARLIADPDYSKAEFAVVVASDLKGKGLGWTLMEAIIAYARAEGLGTLYGDVLAENITMLSMCQELGFTVETDPSEQSVNKVTLRL